MRTHDKKDGQFWGFIKIRKNAPRFHTAVTREDEPPYRFCEETGIIRLFGKYALMLGTWQHHPEPLTGEQAERFLQSAVSSSEIIHHRDKWSRRVKNERKYAGSL